VAKRGAETTQGGEKRKVELYSATHLLYRWLESMGDDQMVVMVTAARGRNRVGPAKFDKF
jgi:hypothetical protein